MPSLDIIIFGELSILQPIERNYNIPYYNYYNYHFMLLTH